MSEGKLVKTGDQAYAFGIEVDGNVIAKTLDRPLLNDWHQAITSSTWRMMHYRRLGSRIWAAQPNLSERPCHSGSYDAIQ